jgi:magnesium transporter
MIMNERQEQTADVLGKLTVLGTIVLPMNIICGMWGMNVKVPGQDVDNLYWFWSSMFLVSFCWGDLLTACSHFWIGLVCAPGDLHSQTGVQDCIV